MRRLQQILGTVMLVGVLCGAALWGSVPAWASEDGTPSLVISQAKITSSNGQFVTLYNSTDNPLDASNFQLEYFNNYDLDKATSSRVIGLSGTLPPHGYLLLVDDNLQLCHQQIINAVSLGFSSTSGLVTVQKTVQPTPGGPVDNELQDYFAWSKSSSSQVETLPTAPSASLLRQPRDDEQRPLVDEPGEGSWLAVQPDDQDPCNYLTVNGIPTTTTVISSSLLPSVEPPVTFRTAANFGSSVSVSDNKGLRAPVITELLPNPAGTGTDKTQEFIEIYNPNNRSFGLTGYSLQVGLGRLRFYSFPAGASLKPHSFTVFYSAKTKLSLSNTASQVSLMDPSERAITKSSIYQKAKDGISWARANGKWYWSTVITPGRANIISEPVKKTKRTKSTSRVKYGPGLVKGGKSSSDSSPQGLFDQMAKASPIHPAVLALVGGGALLYGAYEYRADLAGRFEQLKSKLSFGRRNR